MVIDACAYMTSLAKPDVRICDGSVRVTMLARRLSYRGCQISDDDGSMGIAPRIDRDVAVSSESATTRCMWVYRSQPFRDGHSETARQLPR